MRAILTTLILVIFGLGIAQADDATNEALKKTQDMLNDPGAVKEYIKNSKDPKAKQADDYANKISGGDAKAKQEMFSIAGSIMEVIVKESNGDVKVMQKMMDEASTNPEKFLKSLTPQQRARIKALGDKLGPRTSASP